MVEVIGLEEDLESIGFHHLASVGKHKIAVRLEVDNAPAAALLIESHESGRGKPFVHLLHLRVRKGKPNLADFAGCEKGRQHLDAGSDKGGIFSPFWSASWHPTTYGRL